MRFFMLFFNEEFTWILDLKNCHLFHTFIDSPPLKKFRYIETRIF